METPTTYPKGTTKEQWDKYYADLEKWRQSRDKYESELDWWCFRPNKPGYEYANNH